MNEQEKINYDEIAYGRVIEELLDSEDVTDIEIRPTADNDELGFSLWVVDVIKSRYRVDLHKLSDEDLKELKDFVNNVPNQLAILMHTEYGPKDPALDAEYVYKNKAILRFNSVNEVLTGSSKGIPLIAIRKSSYKLRLTRDYMLQTNYVDSRFFDLMEVLIGASCNVMIAGQVGSGKTSLLKYLVRYIKSHESIITIEDTREAFLEIIYPEKETGALKSISNEEKCTYEDINKYTLRQNSQWDIVSEIRGQVVSDLMDAVSSGHNLISTVHADGVEEIPFRMVNMAKLDGARSRALEEQIYHDINIGVFIHYYNDDRGSHRQLKEVAEYYIDDNGKKKVHLIYYFDEKEKCFKTDKILSKKIINKIIRKENVDTSKIKGVFLDV